MPGLDRSLRQSELSASIPQLLKVTFFKKKTSKSDTLFSAVLVPFSTFSHGGHNMRAEFFFHRISMDRDISFVPSRETNRIQRPTYTAGFSLVAVTNGTHTPHGLIQNTSKDGSRCLVSAM